MRTRSSFSLAILLALSSLACRQPSAELRLPTDGEAEAEPAGRGPTVFVEAATEVESGPGVVLDWAQVDPSLSGLVEGERYRVDYDADHPWLGATTPLVTIVVFSDYQCPYCGKLDETLAALRARYPDRLRVVFRQFPLPMHRNAALASKIALGAQQRGQFGAIHRWLFDNSRSLDRSEVVRQLASVGLDAQQILSEIDAGMWDDRVAADMELGTRYGVRGTPAYFIDGRSFSGARPLDEIEAVVREELELSERLIAAGSAPEQVWARKMLASSEAQTQAQAQAQIASSKRYPTALAGLPERGAKQPSVELLMCSDFDCPYCQRATATVEQLLNNHPKQLAVYFRHHPLPMHKNARAAHRAAVAAENQGEFWAMYELLFANPKQRSDAELEAFAKQLGLDMKRFRKDVAAKKTDERIDAQAAYCQQDLDATGTPTFFVNGRKIVGARALDDFEAVIAEELAGTP